VRFDGKGCVQSVIRQCTQKSVRLSLDSVRRNTWWATERLGHREVQRMACIGKDLAEHLLERIKSSKESSPLLWMGKGIEVAIPSIDSGDDA
jgi:hypothetical protein